MQYIQNFWESTAITLWGLTLLAVVLLNRQPPAGPSPQLVEGARSEVQYEFRFDEPRAGYTLSCGSPRWSQTPCGRTTHVRAWADCH